eukprot:TRINITY_DN50351_c0_g1_i3.p1 TRINITY_DN50351_c0_g1~~TRINITY_DN50351_c0_g1_i3.p1  ORF type:complete len:432 (+),score=67.54 TRINITY_DN50351_c0_g1_i3:235-1530(+)
MRAALVRLAHGARNGRMATQRLCSSGRKRPPPPSPPLAKRAGSEPKRELVKYEGPTRGFGMSIGLLGGIGILGAVAAWFWSYQAWLRKNRPGSRADGLTPLSELSDIASYATSGQADGCVCAGCRRQLHGRARLVIVDGKLWHEEHAKCDECSQEQRPMEPPLLADEDGLWCKRHYMLHDATNCSVCRDPLVADEREALRNGDQVCKLHRNQASCFGCGRITPSAATSNAINLCSMCSESAVWDQGTADQLFDEVAYSLASDFGIDVGLGDIELRIGSMEEGQEQYNRSGRAGKACVQGLTRMKQFELQVGSKRVVHKEVDGVWLQQGLPRILLSKVIAHELTHVWLAKNKLHKIPLQLEEGLCELVSYLWVAECASRLSSSKEAAVSYTHLRAHETPEHLVCRLLLEKKKKQKRNNIHVLSRASKQTHKL